MIAPQLEDTDFKITHDDDWTLFTAENGVKLYQSPTKDIWEFVEGEFAGEQKFTWDAAMRETKKAGKEIPEDWSVYTNDSDFPEKLGLRKSGIYNRSGTTYNHGTLGYYWSSVFDGTHAFGISFKSGTEVCEAGGKSFTAGFSVRCLKQ
jgi:hypothetical protein